MDGGNDSGRRSLETWITSHWYRSSNHRSLLSCLLLPLSKLFNYLAARRRRKQQSECGKSPVPVVVVGNIAVGGTGKTPVVIALVEALKAKGVRCGVISRGYGGTIQQFPYVVTSSSTAKESGDEPLLIAQRTGVPVVIDPDRRRALDHLVANHEIDMVISDDGLQHYRLPRDYEIAVVDGMRGLGNGLTLPAGPLRELPERLATVDFVLTNGTSEDDRIPGRAELLSLKDEGFFRVDNNHPATLSAMQVEAVAAIGNPARFFQDLEEHFKQVNGHPFPDHHQFQQSDIPWETNPVIMTEKDAVKCRSFAKDNWYYLKVTGVLPETLLPSILDKTGMDS